MDTILSHEERTVARALAEGRSVEAVAEDRGVGPADVERTVERIREKTGRALATLAASPFAGEVARDADPETVRAVRSVCDALE